MTSLTGSFPIYRMWLCLNPPAKGNILTDSEPRFLRPWHIEHSLYCNWNHCASLYCDYPILLIPLYIIFDPHYPPPCSQCDSRGKWGASTLGPWDNETGTHAKQNLRQLLRTEIRESRERERITPFQPHKALIDLISAGAASASLGRSRIHNQRE